MTSRVEALAHVEAWARELLEAHDRVAHGWLHVDRVRRLAVTIARAEGVDPWLAALAALIHDVGRTTPGPGSEHGRRSAELAAPTLAALPLTDEEREDVLHAARWHNSGRDDTSLLCVLRDADMLDGIGAIGLMRALMSKYMLPPYDPEVLFDELRHWPPRYVADQLHMQIKFMDWMNTETGRGMARERYEFMWAFIRQVRREVGVEVD